MFVRLITAAALLSACAAPHAPIRSETARAEQPAVEPVVFRGMCDASGAVTLGDALFAVADDEDNVLRVYDSRTGGDPLFAVDVSPSLALPIKKKAPEADIEAATRVGDVALWLTSHGRSSKGKLQPGRFRFFATTAPAEGVGLAPVGTAYDGLLEVMLADPRFAPFDFQSAALIAPKEHGGLNIEGMTRHLDGSSVVIGFRNPRPSGKAIVVTLKNPLQVIEGQAPQLDAPQLLDLAGLGVRGISLWRGRYLISAGAVSSEAPSRLFSWDGSVAPKPLGALPLPDLNPEAFVSYEARDAVLLLSDDGSRLVDGVECKKLEDPSRKSFRGVWFTPKE
jgi:hypothetical protein